MVSPAYADDLYTSDGFLKQINTYRHLPLSPSNAPVTAGLNDAIMPASSVGSVSNTVDFSGCNVNFFDASWNWVGVSYVSLGGTFSYVVPAGDSVKFMEIQFSPSASLPVAGRYKYEVDFSSDTSLSYGSVQLCMVWSSKNVGSKKKIYNVENFHQSSGDLYFSVNIDLATSMSKFYESIGFSDVVPAGGAIGGRLSASFNTLSAGSSIDTITPGVAPSTSDIQSGIASTTNQINYSVNQVYDSIIALTQHISNQLAALWDQMYNYMHVPTYNKLQEILLALKAIGQGSDIQKVVDQIEESTSNQTVQIMQNDDKNTDKVEAAVEKHGNFIIDGLKSLFIPSDDFFKAWFDDIYQFFSDRLGFLMLPIDILIQFIGLFQNAGSGFSGIPFPEFKWIDGSVIIPAQTVGFDFLEEDWGQDIQSKLYFVTNVFMIGCLIDLMHRKLEEVLRS